jgi:hypothetical protein
MRGIESSDLNFKNELFGKQLVGLFTKLRLLVIFFSKINAIIHLGLTIFCHLNLQICFPEMATIGLCTQGLILHLQYSNWMTELLSDIFEVNRKDF